MLEQIRAWLNGSRAYTQGVHLYSQVGENDNLKKLFFKGQTDYCYKRLQSELMQICIDLKSKQTDEKKPDTEAQMNAEKPAKGTGEKREAQQDATPPVENANPELYAACKLEADKMYKQAMNARAVLFNMVPDNKFEDNNRQELVTGRRDLCLKVLELYSEASLLYDRADQVKNTGVLPDQDAAGEEDISLIPDILIKQKLDNARKNYNKIKARVQTPERVALGQKHLLTIEKLEARWLSLQPKK